MGFLEPYIPPSRENWELLTYYWQFYPLASAHLLTSYASIELN